MNCLFSALMLSTLLLCGMVHGQQGDSVSEDEEKAVGYWNWSLKTMGGRQFWTDTRHLDGWRIQRNHVTGHCRVLDSNDVRKAWGNLTHCERELEQFAVQLGLRGYAGKVVVLLHGLVRSHSSMEPMADYLRDNGYRVINFEYASSRGSIGDHAKALHAIIEQLGPEVTEVNFVGHSMGNLVVRHYLHDSKDESTGEEGDSRIGRMVMIGPPNQGSRIARLLKNSVIFGVATGTSGIQLAATWEQLEPRLSTPRFEFGIIAGGQGDDTRVSNFLLTGKDDFTVSVEETKLPGAHDFLVRPLFHSTMMKKQETLEYTLSFLKHGYFVSEQARQPIVPSSVVPSSVDPSSVEPSSVEPSSNETNPFDRKIN